MSAVAKYYRLTSKFVNDYIGEVISKLTDALDLDEEQVEKMRETLKVDDVLDVKKLRQGGSKTGVTRAPTEYNLFVRSKIKELKEAHPDMDRKKLMVEAAAAWSAKKRAAAEEEGTTASPAKKNKK